MRPVAASALGVAAVLGLGLGLVVPSTGAEAASPKKAKCDAVSGWSAVADRPATLAPGGPLGLYVWNAKGAWVVAATGPDRRQKLFQGSITFDAPITGKPVGLQGISEVVTVGATSATFTFKNFGRLDSVAITAPCASSASITGTIDGVPLAPTQLFIGAAAANPAAVPAVLRRDAAAPASSSTVAPVADPACPATAWPANTLGKPSIPKRRNLSTSLYAWNDKSTGGWQVLAVADPGRPALFEGRISANAPVVYQPVGLDARDSVRVEGNSVAFSFRTSTAGDGFIVLAPCATQITIDVAVDGQPLAPSDLLIGGAATPASGIPFTMSR